MTKFDGQLIAILSGWLAIAIVDDIKTNKKLKSAKAEIELISNFCADSIPPKVLENGRSSEKGRN